MKSKTQLSRQKTAQRIAEAIKECERIHSEQEVLDAARALGVAHWLPSTQTQSLFPKDVSRGR